MHGISSVRERFLRHVAITVDVLDCWWWIGAIRNEYGVFWFNGRAEYAHRVSYTLYRGEIPHGSVVMHICDNPLCVNHLHLRTGTQSENVSDGVRKDRIRPFRERCHRDDLLVSAVIHDESLGFSQRAISLKYNLPLTSVRRILGKVK